MPLLSDSLSSISDWAGRSGESVETRLEMLEGMLDTVTGLVCAFSSSGRMLYWNRHFCTVTGYSDREIGRMQLPDFTDSGRYDRLPGILQAVVEQGEANLEIRLQTKDGRQIPHEFKLSAMHEDEEVVICGIGRDIRRRKRRDEKRRRSEQKYRRLFEESQEGIIITTPDEGILDVNPAVCRLTGYTREELLGMKITELYVDPTERAERIDALRRRDTYHTFEWSCLRKDGTEVICRISASMWQDPDGEIEAIQSFVRNISEEKRTVQALEESEEKFRRLAEESPVGIGLVQDGLLKYVNPAQAAMFGYRPADMIGNPNREFVHPDDLPHMKRQMERRLQGEADTVHYMFRGITREGRTRLFEVRGGRVRYQGRPAVVGTLVDLTERRRLQRDVLRIQEEERRRIGQDLHDGVGSFLAGLSMTLDVLVAKADESASGVTRELREISGMVRESSYDVRRISRGLNPLSLEDEGLRFVLDRLASTGGTDEKIVCRYEGAERLTSLSDEVATHLYWIVQEALTNARKYASADRITISIVCGSTDLILTVSDDGIGFERTEGAVDGLGLRTMRYRAELLNGTLDINSTPGSGTTVECRLPVDPSV